jgi:quinol monooxygenase YgiN
MIKIVAKNVVKADKIEEFKTLALELVKKTNELDEGCISYELFQDISNPTTLTIIEEWESKEALNNHMKAKHFLEITVAMKEFSEGAGEVNLYQKLS